MTEVANIRALNKCVPSWKKDPSYVYIGRKSDRCHFGNPFTVNFHGRDAAIEKFRVWLTGEGFHEVAPERREWILAHLNELADKVLVCYCHPLACHGDVYKEMLNG